MKLMTPIVWEVMFVAQTVTIISASAGEEQRAMLGRVLALGEQCDWERYNDSLPGISCNSPDSCEQDLQR